MKCISRKVWSLLYNISICCLILLVYQSTTPCGTKKLAEQDAAQVVLSQLNYQDQTTATEGQSK